MNVKIEKISGCKKKLVFTLPEENFIEALDVVFAEKVQKIEVKGFRKGKLPREVYNKRFGEESLYEDAINEVVNNAYREALEKHKIDAVGQPELDVDFESVGKGKKMKFSIQVEVWPEVELGQYTGLEIEKKPVQVSEEDINKYIEQKRQSKAELEVVEDGVLENGYTAVFDFEGFVDGVAFEGGKSENYSLEIGSHQFIPGFEEQMVGMKPEENKDIEVTFPENYQAENLKGKKAVFKIHLHEMKKRILPELNDEFIKDLEVENIATVKEYQSYVKDLLTKERTEDSERKFADDALNKAIENATLEVPHALVEEEINRQVSQMENQAKTYQLPLETLLQYYGIADLEQYKKTIEPGAIMSVKQRAVFLKIAEAEKMKVTAKDYNDEFEEVAKEINKPVEEVKNLYTKELIAPYIKMRKVIDLIKDSAVEK
ncbi:MAG: trigger factor [Bacilli bacterium]|jgi:trigger factor|nr:trigger factor [Bacilli bacterium]MDY0063817.1 trigger factor [Bacilli bacterium]